MRRRIQILLKMIFLVAFVDLDENVFASVGLVSELKRKNLKVIGIMKKIKNRERSKLQSADVK